MGSWKRGGPAKLQGKASGLGQGCRPPPPGAALSLGAFLSAHRVSTDHTREISNRPTPLFQKTSQQIEVPLCPYSLCPSDKSCQEVLLSLKQSWDSQGWNDLVKVLNQFSPRVNCRTVQTANSEAGQTEILSLKATVLLCQECVPVLQSFWHLFSRGKKCLGNVVGMSQMVLAQYSDNSSLFLIIELSLK